MNETGKTEDARTERRPTRWAALVLAVAVVALVATAGLRSARNLDAARSQETELRAQIEQARLRVESLEARLASLDEDPATLERLAREQLGMVRPGDVVIVLPPEDVPATDTVAARSPHR